MIVAIGQLVDPVILSTVVLLVLAIELIAHRVCAVATPVAVPPDGFLR
jgi:hypothetical protein